MAAINPVVRQWESSLDQERKTRDELKRIKGKRGNLKTESTAPKRAPRLKYQSTKRTLKHLPERKIPSGKAETESTAPTKAAQIKYENTKRGLKNLPERSVRGGYAETESAAPRKAPQLKRRSLGSLRHLPERAISAVKHSGRKLGGALKRA